MIVTTIPFIELKDLKEFGVVIRGAGGNAVEWAEGIADDLFEEKIIVGKPEKVFSTIAQITGNILGSRGRRDLLLTFNNEARPDIGRLAMWRIRWNGKISWVDDFIVNNAADYGQNVVDDDDEEDEEAT